MELKKRYGVDSQKRGIFTIFGLFFVNYFRRGNAVYMKLNNVHRIQGNEIKLGSHKLRWNTKLFTAVHHRMIYCSHFLARQNFARFSFVWIFAIKWPQLFFLWCTVVKIYLNPFLKFRKIKPKRYKEIAEFASSSCDVLVY